MFLFLIHFKNILFYINKTVFTIIVYSLFLIDVYKRQVYRLHAPITSSLSVLHLFLFTIIPFFTVYFKHVFVSPVIRRPSNIPKSQELPSFEVFCSWADPALHKWGGLNFSVFSVGLPRTSSSSCVCMCVCVRAHGQATLFHLQKTFCLLILVSRKL